MHDSSKAAFSHNPYTTEISEGNSCRIDKLLEVKTENTFIREAFNSSNLLKEH